MKETFEEAKERARKECDLEWANAVLFGIYPTWFEREVKEDD